jgi:hypothetical protein
MKHVDHSMRSYRFVAAAVFRCAIKDQQERVKAFSTTPPKQHMNNILRPCETLEAYEGRLVRWRQDTRRRIDVWRMSEMGRRERVAEAGRFLKDEATLWWDVLSSN